MENRGHISALELVDYLLMLWFLPIFFQASSYHVLYWLVTHVLECFGSLIAALAKGMMARLECSR